MFLQTVLSHSDHYSKPDSSCHEPDLESPVWICEHVTGACICASVLQCSTFHTGMEKKGWRNSLVFLINRKTSTV